MLDIQAIRTDPAALDAALKRRNLPALSAKILKLDEQRRALQTSQQQLQAQRNTLSKQVGELKAKKQDAEALMSQVKALVPEMEKQAADEAELATQLNDVLSRIPNIPFDDVPTGKDEDDNQEIRRWGEPKKFSFKPKEHDDVANALGMLDLATAAKISGARFSWLQGPLARLDRAIFQACLDLLTLEKGFTEVHVPFMVNAQALYGTGNLPKFAEDLFTTTDDRWLIPTSEVPLTNYAMDKIFQPDELPKAFAAWSPCFRSEAGSAGKDTKGIIRQHQFDKVEMVILTTPEKSQEAHEFMTSCTELFLQRLGLPYRTIVLCTGDMGFASRKTYDIEVWVPSQNKYREISSCSNCGDFQARRMNGRLKTDKGNVFIHTLNGSGITRRALVAILENYQREDGSVEIPALLQPYMGGLKELRRA